MPKNKTPTGGPTDGEQREEQMDENVHKSEPAQMILKCVGA